MPHWLRHGAIRLPPKGAQPVAQSPLADAVFLSSLRAAELFTVKCVSPIAALVPLLRQAISPNAIAGLVGAVIVSALKSESFRPFTHVCKEGVKAVAPTLAHNNSATAIIRKFLPVRAVAAPPHLYPRAIGGRVGKSVSRNSFKPSLFHARLASAATTLGPARLQIRARHLPNRPAFTTAKPLYPDGFNDRPKPMFFHDDEIAWDKRFATGGHEQ